MGYDELHAEPFAAHVEYALDIDAIITIYSGWIVVCVGIILALAWC